MVNFPLHFNSKWLKTVKMVADNLTVKIILVHVSNHKETEDLLQVVLLEHHQANKGTADSLVVSKQSV